MTARRRAIGIVRKSKGHEGASPIQQRESIGRECERRDLELVEVHEELEVKGATPLAKRKGLLAAIEAVEAGRAEVVVAAYFDRLMRSLTVQAELVSRVEAAGGEVLAVDVGQVTRKDASKKLSGNLLGAVAEYHADMVRERSGDAQRRAVKRGVPCLANIPPGYKRGPDGRLVVVPAEVPVVQEAFKMRAAGHTLKEVCAYMNAHGVRRTWRSTQSLLASPIVLGEIRFGEMFNPAAHPAIVDGETFRRVQGMIVSRGRRAKSERLLARQGILRCGTCGGRMSVGSRNKPIKTTGEQGRYPMYRCSPTSDCPRRVAISAEIAEATIAAWVKDHRDEVMGTASGGAGASKAAAELERAQAALEAAMRSYKDAGLMGEPVAVETLGDLREVRDRAKEHHDNFVQIEESRSVTYTLGDWDELKVDEQRALIQAMIKDAIVAPGRGDKRIKITRRRVIA